MTGRLGIATAGVVFLAAMSGCRKEASRAEAPVPESAVAAAVVQGKHLVYPWSVVGGGVDSPAAMEAAMASDPVVALHYAELRPADFRTERLPGPRTGHVSYRIGDRVYWTRRAVSLAAGETVLTDGLSVLRGRCGNRFSPVPREPVAPAEMEPPESLLDEPLQIGSFALTPATAAEATVETKEFQNPMVRAENPDENSVLPVPQMADALPPVWVTGGDMTSAGGGLTGLSGDGATSPAPGTTMGPAMVPEVQQPLIPVSIAVPASQAGPAGLLPAVPLPMVMDAAPPMVLMSLLLPSPSPGTRDETWTAPDFPPVLFPPPSQILIPPPGSPGTPPVAPTDGLPPGTLPPFLPPPALPEALPDTSIPEPGAWVLAVIGLLAIWIGSIRRR